MLHSRAPSWRGRESTIMSVRDTLIASLEAQRQEIEQRLKSLPQTTLDQQGVVGAASIKNILAQLTAWELVVVQALLEGIETGVRSPVLGEIERAWVAWNAAQSAESESLTPEDQIIEWDWRSEERRVGKGWVEGM